MNITLKGIGTANTSAYKISEVNISAARQGRAANREEEKKDKQNHTAVVMTISGASKDRSKDITKRFQAMKETLQEQIGALNERLQKASGQGDTKLEEQLTESIKALTEDYNALDEQLNASLFAERQRLVEQAKAKEDEAAKKREAERDKHKPEEERLKEEGRKSFEFFAKSDKAKESIQNNKIQKAKLERTKGRIEGEMAQDAARKADSEQSQKARKSELDNFYASGRLVSDVPHVSDKTILTELKRIKAGEFTADEGANTDELNKLNAGIKSLERGIGNTLNEMNEAVSERVEDAKDGVTKTEAEKEQQKDEQKDEQKDQQKEQQEEIGEKGNTNGRVDGAAEYRQSTGEEPAASGD